MGYLICNKCKSYYKLRSGESAKNFVDQCDCGGKLRYVKNLDIVDPQWRPVQLKKKPTKKEILKNKIHSLSSIPLNLKNSLIQFKNNLQCRLQNRQNWNHNPNYASQTGNINSIINEINFNNIRWTVVISAALAITAIDAFTQGIFTLLILVILVAVGYLFNDRIIGIKNALITGAISFFFGSLFTSSFLLLIPLTIVGAINGAVCGWIGGYLKTRL
ncbi:MAG: MFS transporter [Methanobacterium sp. BRmetb2]|nr:MAG: MFS transporter [Methanobacterium sp. BRmetb2]